MSLYFRVKRNNQTIFLSAELTDTIAKLKGDVAIVNKLTNENPTEYIRFIYQNNSLDDKKTIQQLNIPNDSVIFMVYKTGENTYEDIAPSVLQSLQ
ncbi:hypothetical protein DLAC_11615 [Tieghemostelium lacteum]|uniref:Ubiquitin-like domain-containing protein n=1 Tax=Tieghemostelium lacteum TaxID=361077 RepID=A0A151ZIW7_TIELA|nr:hypothetical protein DLAC_11615 [Tieghemostelium lacteum]|eukprot:KYQ93794.1 hypothetical protein DLAC_11615 [Tieghemostelium lacteum]